MSISILGTFLFKLPYSWYYLMINNIVLEFIVTTRTKEHKGTNGPMIMKEPLIFVVNIPTSNALMEIHQQPHFGLSKHRHPSLAVNTWKVRILSRSNHRDYLISRWLDILLIFTIVGFTGCGTDGKYSWSNLEKYQHFDKNAFWRSYSVDTIMKDGKIMFTNLRTSYFFSGFPRKNTFPQ